jgi:hypothetical protein
VIWAKMHIHNDCVVVLSTKLKIVIHIDGANETATP